MNFMLTSFLADWNSSSVTMLFIISCSLVEPEPYSMDSFLRHTISVGIKSAKLFLRIHFPTPSLTLSSGLISRAKRTKSSSRKGCLIWTSEPLPSSLAEKLQLSESFLISSQVFRRKLPHTRIAGKRLVASVTCHDGTNPTALAQFKSKAYGKVIGQGMFNRCSRRGCPDIEGSRCLPS